MIPVKLTELYYYLTSKTYFDVWVLVNNRRVKRFIQRGDSTKAGESEFLVCKPLKSAWVKPDADSVILSGLKFICFVNLDNAIPLKIYEETVIESGEIINKEYKKTTIREDIEKQKKCVKDGKPVNLVEIHLPPTVVFQKIEAGFIKQILSVPHEKNDILIYGIIALVILLAIGGYLYFSNGVKPL